MNKTAKVILSSVLSMGLCASIIAGSTFALFTSEDNVNIAITSGKVDVEASITSLATNSDATVGGSLEDIMDWQDATSDPSSGSFTGEFATGGTATYSVTDGVGTLALEQIAPGDAVKFTFTVTNESTVSVKYQIRMRTTEDEYVGGAVDPEPGTKLSSALEVKLGEEDVKSGLVYVASAWTAAGAAAPQTVVYIRLPKDVGNQYQQRKCSISLSVLAVQGNAKETTYCEENGHKIENDVCIYCGFENPFKGASNHDDTGTTYVIKGADPTVTELEIPAEINGKKVELATRAFVYNSTISSVKFDEGFTEIADRAFNSSSVSKVELPDTLVSIGESAFSSTKLTSIVIPDSVETLGSSVFELCGSLTNVVVGKNVQAISSKAFSDCSALESVTIKSGAESIEFQAFQRCTSLTAIEIPGSVKTIGSSAFSGCTHLAEITIGEGLESISQYTFMNCTSIEEITLPDSFTTVAGGENATPFDGCSSLTTIHIGTEHSHLTAASAKMFMNANALKTITFAGDTATWKSIFPAGLTVISTVNPTIVCTDGSLNARGNPITG